jgi:hypothetical protein
LGWAGQGMYMSQAPLALDPNSLSSHDSTIGISVEGRAFLPL